jgi:hypothetical protein
VVLATDCRTEQLEFEGVRGRRVEAAFDAGRTSTDGGLLLLREVEQRRRILRRFAGCFVDHREPKRIQHTVEELVAQRVYALCCGYEDLNDHEALRDDLLLAVAVGKREFLGARREQPGEAGHVLAGKSTLNRVELTPSDATSEARYKKVAYDGEAIDRLFLDVFLEAHRTPPKSIVLDLDATDDPLHGKQEGRFFHGYYRCYCYLPLYIFCDDFLLAARLRTSDIDGSDGALEEVQRITAQIRRRWPKVRIILRADSGFARDALMAWCESQGVDYVFGLARNSRLEEILQPDLDDARHEHESTGQPVRRFKDFRYSTLQTWSCERRVVGKAEQLPGKANPRFVVTSLAAAEYPAQPLYEQLYCARGDMENRIKEQQLGMFADRTSTHHMRSNQLRLYFSSVAYVLMNELRRLGLRHTSLAKAQVDTIRVRLLKVAAIIKLSVRRVVVSLSSVFPLREVYVRALANIRASPAIG